MDCEKCGSPVPEGVSFCPTCGAPLTLQPTAPYTPPPTQPRPQYLPPQDSPQQQTSPHQYPPPPDGHNRILLWIGVAVASVLIATLAAIIPLALRGGDEPVTSSTTTDTSESTTTTSIAPTTTIAPVGPVGDSSGSWVEIAVPGGPWAALEVAVSDKTLLLVSTVPAGYRLSAIDLDSGEVTTVSESEALFGADLDGDIAVWWEASGWDEDAGSYADQYIKSCRLPDGSRNTLASSSSVHLSMPQVAMPWITWIQSEQWADDPEYWRMSIMGASIDDSGAPIGSPLTMVSSALAFAMGDSSWQYSLSSDRLTWENHAEIDGYGIGTHVLGTDMGGHEWIGAESWRPTLWGDLLVYKSDSLRLDDLATGTTQAIDPSGDFATAGPTFAAFYKPSSSGSYLVARGYGGVHEQILGDLNAPPYFCPPVAVAAHHIAYAFDDDVHLFEWRPE